ncbi:MYCBP-associated protein family-domain-containing protein [Chytriomyces sp. MP71]|nr:MYCBP-associated protein family-domain-containing protein [Chytriomyces sp. MP71]
MLKQSESLPLRPPLPVAEDGKKTLLIAKQMPMDYMGQELEYTQPNRKPVPLSILVHPMKGPQKQKNGKYIEHTLLGDADDFEEMEGMLCKPIDVEMKEIEEQEPTEDDIRSAELVREEREKEERMRLAREKSERERKRWLDRLYIFQRYRELREEHALRNWKRHSLQWARIERALASKSKKPHSDLLMARLGEYREKIEERDLIFEAFRLLEDQKINFWSKGLRIGNDLLGLIVTAPKGGVRKIERLVTNEAKHYKIPPKTTYRAMRKQEMKRVISKLDPFFKDGVGGFLEIIGKPLDSNQLEKLAERYERKLDQRLNEPKSTSGPVVEFSSEQVWQPPQPSVAKNDPSKLQLRSQLGNLPPLKSDLTADLVFMATHLTFEVLLNEVSRSVLSVYNQSTTAYHFEWRKVVKPNPLKLKAVYDNVQRFYFYHKKGVLLPGTAFDFPIIFKSGSPGIYTETWELVTNPCVGTEVSTAVTLQGFALERDDNKSKRANIEFLLNRRAAETAAKDIIDLVLNNVKPKDANMNSLEKKKMLLTNDEQLFTILNADLNVTYNAKLFDRIEALANEVALLLARPPSLWDRSIRSIYENIMLLEPLDKRSLQLSRLNELVKMSTTTCTMKSSFSPLYIVGYDTFVDLADKISECSEALRKRAALPLQRPAAKFERSDEEEEEFANPEGARKTTPPATDAKKGAPPAKDAKGKAVPPAKNAPPAKGGKKGEVVPADDPSLRPQLAKITRRVPKPDSSKSWSRERRLQEAQYQSDLRREVGGLVRSAVDRVLALFGDVAGYKVDVSLESENEVAAAVEVARGVAKELVDAARVRAIAEAEENEARLAAQKKETEMKMLMLKAEKAQAATALVMEAATPIVPAAVAPAETNTKGAKGKVATSAVDKRKVASGGKDRK